MTITLFDWQQEAYDAMKQHGDGIVEAVTGSGKSILGYKIMEDNPTAKILVVVPTIVLMKQWKDELIKFKVCQDYEIALIGGGYKELPKRVTIAVVNSIRPINWNHPVAQFDYVICDEVHRYCSPENIGFLKKGNFGHKYGLTATLVRTDEMHKLAIEYIGPVLYTLSVADANEGGYISDFDVICTAARMTQPEMQDYFQVNQSISYNMSFFSGGFPEAQKVLKFRGPNPHKRQAIDLVKGIQERRKLLALTASKEEVAMKIIKKHEGKKILIFDEFQDSANKLYEHLLYKGMNPVIYHSGITKYEKEESMRKFRSNESNIMISVKALDEGVNVPAIEIGIIINGNSQKRQIIQRLGRIIRKVKDKTATLYMLYVPFTKDMDYIKKRIEFLGAEEKVKWLDEDLPKQIDYIEEELDRRGYNDIEYIHF